MTNDAPLFPFFPPRVEGFGGGCTSSIGEGALLYVAGRRDGETTSFYPLLRVGAAELSHTRTTRNINKERKTGPVDLNFQSIKSGFSFSIALSGSSSN